ncbi:MAG: PIN domain-containing protein [Jatrophihabitans sp.]|uniref:PIN domain-containing protein n=1 Tax=Jatrophihabitans sp. TaxID=1932789 RepID=UPI003F804C04
MLRLLVDTSTWLDLAKRRDGQRWIVTLRVLRHQGRLQLLVPAVVIEEFARNRPRIEASMTASVSERLRMIKKDLDEYGGDDQAHALEVIEGLAHQVPLIGAMTTRNFDDISELLAGGKVLDTGPDQERRVIERGLAKRAPFHRHRNSVADALLVELYATEVATSDLAQNPHAFVTSNHEDFSEVNGDRRQPHPDLAPLFAVAGSTYALGITGLEDVLHGHFGEEVTELLDESDFREEPRRLDEILDAEQELFDRIWYERSLSHEHQARDEGNNTEAERTAAIAMPGRLRVEEKLGVDNLGPYDDFEWGMLHGKLSALRWVLGSDWDFLDT